MPSLLELTRWFRKLHIWFLCQYVLFGQMWPLRSLVALLIFLWLRPCAILVGVVCDLLNLENYSAKSFSHGNPWKISTSKIECYTVVANLCIIVCIEYNWRHMMSLISSRLPSCVWRPMYNRETDSSAVAFFKQATNLSSSSMSHIQQAITHNVFPSVFRHQRQHRIWPVMWDSACEILLLTEIRMTNIWQFLNLTVFLRNFVYTLLRVSH